MDQLFFSVTICRGPRGLKQRNILYVNNNETHDSFLSKFPESQRIFLKPEFERKYSSCLIRTQMVLHLSTSQESLITVIFLQYVSSKVIYTKQIENWDCFQKNNEKTVYLNRKYFMEIRNMFPLIPSYVNLPVYRHWANVPVTP